MFLVFAVTPSTNYASSLVNVFTRKKIDEQLARLVELNLISSNIRTENFKSEYRVYLDSDRDVTTLMLVWEVEFPVKMPYVVYDT